MFSSILLVEIDTLIHLPSSDTSGQNSGVQYALHEGSAEGNIGQQPPEEATRNVTMQEAKG